ncbi:MAG: hypothetical protein K9K37_09880 [Desulfocapsa sp.]|nr:hypothetical protein [Desulfocapsa sp.]
MNSRKSQSLDYYLILATVGVLFALSVICIFGMFYFKFAAVQQLQPLEKMAYMARMNQVVVPFIIGLILLLGICVPKRLLSAQWLVRFGVALGVAGFGFSLWLGVTSGLIVVLAASLILQLVVLILAVAGSKRLHFEKSGYWVRVGSSLIHLGFILFVLDLLLYKHLSLHLFLFWVTTGSSVLGMLCCFYSQGMAATVSKFRGH